MSSEDLLVNTLSTFGFPVIRQGSLAADESYPDNFFTFWNNTTAGKGFYDNDNIANVADFDVNFYSISPQDTYNKLELAITALKAQNFVIVDHGHDVGSDVETHTGRGIHVLLINF